MCKQCVPGLSLGGGKLSSKTGGGRREPGNIRWKRCRLLAPSSGGTNQIAVHSAKNCQLENELISVDYTSKVGEISVFGCAEGTHVQRVQDRSSL